MNQHLSLSIIIPTYNEDKTIYEVLVRSSQLKLINLKEIIVVNDGSTDNTKQEIDRFLESYLNHNKISISYISKNNGGKGSALIEGYRKAKSDILCCLDADLELLPEEIPNLIEPFILNENVKVVYGSRILGQNPKNASLFYWGGRAVSVLTNLLYGCKVTDQPNGFKLFHRELIPLLLNNKYSGFEWEAEITAQILKSGYKIYEVPVSYLPRSTGKKLKWYDGVKIAWVLIKMKFFSK